MSIIFSDVFWLNYTQPSWGGIALTSNREAVLKNLLLQARLNHHIIGVSCGTGLAAKQAERGGADLILALNSGRFRQMGEGSLAGFMPFTNSNKLVMEFGTRELLTAVKIPVIFGINATDPTILLDQFIVQIKKSGFAGINNYPTVGLIDGKFREAIEEQGLTFDIEVDAIHIAHCMDLVTIAFVFSESQAEKMLRAGADVLCVHLGLTMGGLRGAKKALSLEAGTRLANEVFSVSDVLCPDVLKMVYGGPVHTPMDLQYIYNNTTAHGYIGGSTFDRTPTEKAIEVRTREFKVTGQYETDELLQKMLYSTEKLDYVSLVKEYVATNYMHDISFSDLASITHVSRSYLSVLFRKETGRTFPAYLANFRIHKACEIIRRENLSFAQIAQLVGFKDYAHFSKTFKRVTSFSPINYADSQKKI